MVSFVSKSSIAPVCYKTIAPFYNSFLEKQGKFIIIALEKQGKLLTIPLEKQGKFFFLNVHIAEFPGVYILLRQSLIRTRDFLCKSKLQL